MTIVGSGSWPGGDATGGCTAEKLADPAMPCEVTAASTVGAAQLELCTNPVGTNTERVVVTVTPGCHAAFAAKITAAGTVEKIDVPLWQDVYEIQAGGCAGLDILGPSVFITDAVAGYYQIPVRLAAHGTGMTFEGYFVDVGATGNQVVHTSGTLTLTCTGTSTGPYGTSVSGVFTGTYEMV